MNQTTVKLERGSVSLFIVIFAALLITTVTVAFVRLMVLNQEQASMNDLSKSALDSANAGVEDAKRLILSYRKECPEGPDTIKNKDYCQELYNYMNGSNCDTLKKAGLVGDPDPSDGGWIIRQNEDDSQLRQAYTCVKVLLNPYDYVASIAPNASRLIPLKSTGSFDQVVIEWYSQDDLQDLRNADPAATSSKVDLNRDTKLPLPKLKDWPKNRPALLRVQLIQYGDSFQLSDFNKNDGQKTNNATLFLMPSEAGLTTEDFSTDARRSSSNRILRPIACEQNFSVTSTDTQYACKVTIRLPLPIGSSNANNRHAFLRVNQIYNPSTHFRVTLLNGLADVRFNSVQAMIDSTGRANDLFRRVSSRIELESSSIPPVEAAIDLTGSLCKTFLVTDKESDYNPGSCPDNAPRP